MNKADIRALEAQFTELPHSQKKHFLSLLSQLIESQAASFIDEGCAGNTARTKVQTAPPRNYLAVRT
jgi:hypothetical protein